MKILLLILMLLIPLQSGAESMLEEVARGIKARELQAAEWEAKRVKVRPQKSGYTRTAEVVQGIKMKAVRDMNLCYKITNIFGGFSAMEMAKRTRFSSDVNNLNYGFAAIRPGSNFNCLKMTGQIRNGDYEYLVEDGNIVQYIERGAAIVQAYVTDKYWNITISDNGQQSISFVFDLYSPEKSFYNNVQLQISAGVSIGTEWGEAKSGTKEAVTLGRNEMLAVFNELYRTEANNHITGVSIFTIPEQNSMFDHSIVMLLKPDSRANLLEYAKSKLRRN